MEFLTDYGALIPLVVLVVSAVVLFGKDTAKKWIESVYKDKKDKK